MSLPGAYSSSPKASAAGTHWRVPMLRACKPCKACSSASTMHRRILDGDSHLLVYAFTAKVRRFRGNAVRLFALFIVLVGMQVAHAQTAAPHAEPIQHEFAISNFSAESGGVLP